MFSIKKIPIKDASKKYICIKCHRILEPKEIYKRVHCTCSTQTNFIYFDMLWMYIEAKNLDCIQIYN